MKMSSVKLLRENLDNLIKSHDTLINQNKFNEAFNVMKNVHIITEQLRYLGFSVIDEEDKLANAGMLDWYSILEFFIKNDMPQIIQLNYDKENELKHRATGKTHALVRLSHDYNIPIFVGNSGCQISILRDKAKELNLKDITIVDNNTVHSKQYSNKKLFLVDEIADLSTLDLRLDRTKYKFIGFQPKFEQ